MTIQPPIHSRPSRCLRVAFRVSPCLLLLLAAGACTREEVDQKVDRAGEVTHRAADKLDVSLHKAKDEARQVGANVERGSKELGEKIKTFGQQVKKDANDARENVRRQVKD